MAPENAKKTKLFFAIFFAIFLLCDLGSSRNLSVLSVEFFAVQPPPCHAAAKKIV